MLVPRKAYLTAGKGTHREPLVAFELALRDAGIAAQNLVAVSSILPPGCKLIERAEGERSLKPGQILHVVLSRHETTRHTGLLGASIGIAVPGDPAHHGFISEFHAEGLTLDAIQLHAEDLACTMLGSLMGVDLDSGLSSEERAAALEHSGKVAERRSCGSVFDASEGEASCVVAACVFLMDWML